MSEQSFIFKKKEIKQTVYLENFSFTTCHQFLDLECRKQN